MGQFDIALPSAEAVISVDAAAVAEEGWADPERGGVSWRSLVDSERTPSKGMTVGIMSVGAHATLAPHRHTPAEVYYCLDGEGVVTVEGLAYPLRPGITLYIPGDAEHSTSGGPEGVRILYTFPTDSLSDVDYRFSA